jgi:hypothetical protein
VNCRNLSDYYQWIKLFQLWFPEFFNPASHEYIITFCLPNVLFRPLYWAEKKGSGSNTKFVFVQTVHTRILNDTFFLTVYILKLNFIYIS